MTPWDTKWYHGTKCRKLRMSENFRTNPWYHGIPNGTMVPNVENSVCQKLAVTCHIMGVDNRTGYCQFRT